MRSQEDVEVAIVRFSRGEGFRFIRSMDSSSARDLWNLQTNQFHPVSLLTLSPNYWGNERGTGNKHYIFGLKGCQNPTHPNGFFNEFLREDLQSYKRVFEALGGKMAVENSPDQISGLGFSATKRDSVICRVRGYVDRLIKVML